MPNKLNIQLPQNDKFLCAAIGVGKGSAFCLLNGLLVAMIYHVLTDAFSITGLMAGAYFAYISSCAFFIREESLKVIRAIQASHCLRSAPLENLASIVTVILISYTICIYFSINL